MYLKITTNEWNIILKAVLHLNPDLHWVDMWTQPSNPSYLIIFLKTVLADFSAWVLSVEAAFTHKNQICKMTFMIESVYEVSSWLVGKFVAMIRWLARGGRRK